MDDNARAVIEREPDGSLVIQIRFTPDELSSLGEALDSFPLRFENRHVQEAITALRAAIGQTGRAS